MSDIAAAQEQLGRALDDARAGEDRALAQQVRDLGEQLVRLLNGLMRLTRIHSPDNDAFEHPTGDLVETLRRLDELLGQVHLVCVEGQVYVNDVRIRLDDRVGGSIEFGSDLARHACGGLSFHEPLSATDVRTLVRVLAATPDPDRPLGTFQESLRAAGLVTVTAAGLYRLRFTGEEAPRATSVELRHTLDRASGLVSDAWDNLGAARIPNPLPIRRLVNDMVDALEAVDLLEETENAERTGHAAAHARHTLRVATLAVLVGRELGLSASALADLGVAAMFHDVGYAAREDGFAPPFERHGTAGARMLLRQRGFHQAKIKRLLACIEHHRDVASPRGRPSLYARILRIAEDFDTYTRPRPGGAIYGPAEALARMATGVGTRYDPHLFQLFVNRVGPFPPGTVLRLQDERVVVSVSGARDRARFSRPLCRLLRHADGSEPAEFVPVDLAVEGAIAAVLPTRRQ